MGWGNDTRRRVYQCQNGLCQFCGNPMSFDEMVLHHARNRCQGGPSTFENARGRHRHCEVKAHSTYRYGNPTDTHQVLVYRESPQRVRKPSKKELKHHRRMMTCSEQYAWEHYCKTGKL